MTRKGDKQARPGRNTRRLVLWLLGSSIVAFPLARAQLAELAVAESRPERALSFDAGHARALAGMAAAAQSRGQQQEAMAFARAALKREPMNVTALRTLGFGLEQTGDQAGADRILFLAARLGWRDVVLQLWLMRAYALHNDVQESLRRANALARINRLPELTYPIFLASLTNATLRAALAQQMVDRPFWRGDFFYKILNLPADQMPNVGKFIVELAKVGSPVTPAERAIYLNRLVQVGQGETAYSYWLREQRASAATAALPWDGGFEHVLPTGQLGAPFEWQMSPESVGVAAIVQSPKGGQQLSVVPGQKFNATLISQTLVLKPGRYQLGARVEGNTASSGLRWVIRCAPANRELAVDAERGGPEFGPVTFEITQDCTSQTLAMAMTLEGDYTGDGTIMIDDVNLRKVG